MKYNSLINTALNIVLTASVLAAFGPSVRAASGTWTADGSGNWSDTANWLNGSVADGTGSTADFSTLNITANRTVTLDASHTISILNFGDTTPDFNWTLSGTTTPTTLTLGTTPIINVVNQTATLSVPVAGTAGLTKVGAGSLTFLGTNSYTGATLISNGVVNYNGASVSTSGGIFNVGGVAGSAVVNINTTGSITNNGSYYGVGGTQPDTTDTGVGVINLIAGTLNNGANNNYTEIGTGAQNASGSYGCINLSGGTFNTLGGSGIRIGTGGLGVFNQTGGTLNDGRYFAMGSQPNGGGTANAGGLGVANFLGGTATIASGYRILLSDKSGGVAILNLGTEAGGTAVLTSLGSAGLDFVDSGGATAKGILNLNSGTLNLAANMYHNNAAGLAQVNWNGGTYAANANNLNMVSTANGFTNLNVYNGGVVINSQANTITCQARFAAANGNGVYPAGGAYAVTSGGGAGYLGQPIVTVTDTGTGSNVMAIASVTGGVVTEVTLTCPGQGCSVGDVLDFSFSGGGATTPAGTFIHTLTAADLAANTAGGLTKLGTGTLTITNYNTYGGNTLVNAGTLVVNGDGGLGGGSVSVANGATLTLEDGVTNDYISSAGNLVLGSAAVVNLSFTGTNTINALSLSGGSSFQAVGTWGAVGSAADNQSSQFTGAGVLSVSSTPSVSVALASSLNPSLFSQSVTLTVTVSGNSGAATGTVSIEDGATKVATLTLVGGMASFTTNLLAVGVHSLTAVYNGNGSYGATTSVPLTQTVMVDTEIWSGAVSAVWDVNHTANWTTLALGLPGSYQQGDNAQLDDTATGTTAITLGVSVSPLSLLVSNSVQAYSISGAGGIAGATGLSKTGNNLLTLDLVDTYAGDTSITNGTVDFGATSSSSGNGSLMVGAPNGNAVLVINTTNTLSFSDVVSVGGVTGDENDTGVGAVIQNSGTVNYSGADDYLELGAGGGGAYGAYDFNGGVLNTPNSTGIRVGAQGTGLFTQSGGFLNCTRYFAVGTQSGVNNVGGTGVATFTGGAATFSSSYRIIIGDKPGSTGVLNLGTEAGGGATLTNLWNSAGDGGLYLLGDVSAASATVNLNSGVIQLGGAIWRNPAAGGAAALNLNGGVLQAGANGIDLITNAPDQVSGVNLVGNVFSRGLVVDTESNVCSITADLAPVSGNGIDPAAGSLGVTDAGSGYVGEPLVTVYTSTGSGSGAMAVATVTNGSIASVVMTCPGQGYQAGDQVYFEFGSVNAVVPSGGLTYTLQPGDLQPNANGGLTQIGSGQLILTSLNDAYTGATVVSNGVLNIAGSLTGGGPVTVAGGTLGGNGSITGPVTVSPVGTLTAGIGSVGTLTINNSLTLTPGSVCSLKIDQGNAVNDLVQGLSQVNYAGTLMVTNLSGTLSAGENFTLFSATTSAGNFANVAGNPGSGLAYSFNPTNGVLSVVAGVAAYPTNITVSVNGGLLSLSWPADHTGWRLQAQTNSLSAGLGTNWVEVAGSTTTNQIPFPVNPANGSVFFRLAH